MTRYISLFLTLYLGLCHDLFSQDPVAVVNEFQVDFQVVDKAHATERVKKTITVYSKEGERYAQPYVFYDQFIKIKSFECTQKDLGGRELKKFRNSDVLDESITQAGTIYDDSRVKYFQLQGGTYPYIATYEYIVDYNGLLNYPRFTPQPNGEVPVERSSFNVTVPKDLGLRYKTIASQSTPTITENGHQLMYNWEINDLKSIEEEVLSPPSGAMLPTIFLSPNEFAYDGYEGSMESWQDFGKWLYQLIPEESTLSQEEIKEIGLIAEAHETVSAKISALYRYMQKKTRYVSIQLGIGGFQPMPPAKVSQLGYGDCKALSNYMRVILAVADIPAYYTVIGAGKHNESFTYIDFPNSFQANHVILTVPLPADTIFLECTSQKNPCGYLGSFTGDRNALMVTEAGGAMIHTTRYSLEHFLRKTSASFTIQDNGSISGQYMKIYQGVAYEEVEGSNEKDMDEMRSDYLSRISHPGFNLRSISYHLKDDRIPRMEEKIDFEIPGFGQVSGERIFFNPNLFSRWSYQLPNDDHRVHPVVMHEPRYEIDSCAFILPAGFSVESNIKPVQLDTPFGQFKISSHFEGDKLVFFRELKLYDNCYSPELYDQLRSFFKEILKADKSQVVLLKKKT